MSQKSVETITGKILLDPRFRDALLADPDRTLAGFDLTESEKDNIKCLDSETMDLLAPTLAVWGAQIDPDTRGAFFISCKEQGE